MPGLKEAKLSELHVELDYLGVKVTAMYSSFSGTCSCLTGMLLEIGAQGRKPLDFGIGMQIVYSPTL